MNDTLDWLGVPMGRHRRLAQKKRAANTEATQVCWMAR